ncbi:hypothetical protein PsorP6_007303 [Peronosclerospora sorghi]|uniref:Uncharacterized protein n=1 Tax=Peronosclerospora sorghi TaxID=230839 RepID=A0ACC0W8Z2_9STRA|nr:hypothetical protein PsorP6_007303 [Peronosclerospora sorghi]
MAKKRRTSVATSASPAPVTPPRVRRLHVPPRVHISRSGVAASTRSQLTVAQLPVLSPPLKKRVTSRRVGKAVKLQLPDDSDQEDKKEVLHANVTTCCIHNRKIETEEALVESIQPDPYLPETYQRHATVVRHGSSFYNAMLTRARVHMDQSEFMALQVLEYETKFYLWTREGRVGCAGKTTLHGPFTTVKKAIQEFCTLFSVNTNCEWDERHALRYEEGSFTWIELDYSMGTPYSESLTTALAEHHDATEQLDAPPLPPPSSRKRCRTTMWTTSTSSRSSSAEGRDANADGEKACPASTETTATCACAVMPPSRLPPEVQEFVTLISDYSAYAGSVVDDVFGNADLKLPLGRLSKTTIKRGYEALEEIYEALRSRNVPGARLTYLSSYFYSLIPHHAHLDVLDTMVKVGRKVEWMAEVSGAVAHEPVVRRCTARNYVDACYDVLECDLHPLKRSEPEFALIETYIRNSNCCGRKQDLLQLLAVFRVEKPEQETRFEPFRTFGNRRILWHGSHVANWAGILSEGLRIAPPEVASNGRTFGKGLYFTDKVTKAQAYCHCRPTNGYYHCIFALNEVALGESKEMLYSDDNAVQFVHTGAGGRAKGAYFHSCKAVGSCRPDAAGEIVDAYGAIWPVGKPVQPEERTGFHHSEYVIYNPRQTRMRYVVLVKSRY